MSDPKWEEVGGKVIHPPFVEQQRKALLKLRRILEKELESQSKSLIAVREQLHRMKHGGGS